MARLIDADGIKYDVKNCGGWGRPYEYVTKMDIDRMPTVDAVEVVHGRWLIHKVHFHDYAECSLCGEDYGKDKAMIFNYCPNCGAIMDLEVKDA